MSSPKHRYLVTRHTKRYPRRQSVMDRRYESSNTVLKARFRLSEQYLDNSKRLKKATKILIE